MRNNDLYAWDGHYNVDRPYTTNGLNQQTAAGTAGLGYDARGNLTASGSDSYGYDKLNRMTSGPSIALTYDPADRLMQQVAGGTATTRFVYSGGAMIAEMTTAGAVAKRHVPGAGTDEWIVSYDGSGTSTRSFAFADERGSIVALANSSGSVTGVNRYDEYGIPSATNAGRFGYTGQAWLPELGMSYYKARMYSPTLGRFMQTDPIGYGDGMNWYAYVGNDPVNKVDTAGRCARQITWAVFTPSSEPGPDGEIVITRTKVVKSFCLDINTEDVANALIDSACNLSRFLEAIGEDLETEGAAVAIIGGTIGGVAGGTATGGNPGGALAGASFFVGLGALIGELGSAVAAVGQFGQDVTGEGSGGFVPSVGRFGARIGLGGFTKGLGRVFGATGDFLDADELLVINKAFDKGVDKAFQAVFGGTFDPENQCGD